MIASLERLFCSVAEKSARLMFNIDPAWVDRAGHGLVSVAAAPRDAHADRLVSSALQVLYGVRWPSLGALAQRVHRLAVLPSVDVLRVLQAVALYSGAAMCGAASAAARARASSGASASPRST